MRNIAFVIGDLHGGFDLLSKTLERIDALAKLNNLTREEYKIICLGDYIDRGPASRQVVEALMARPDIICIKGNHEDMMVRCYSSVDFRRHNPPDHESEGHWIMNGGRETLFSYGEGLMDDVPAEHIKWMASLPTFYETDNHYFVHAGINPHRPLNEQTDNNRLWIRYEFLESSFDFEKHIVHGHTPSIGPETKHNRTNLDTGSYYTGEQALGIFDLDKNPGRIDILTIERERLDGDV